MRVLLMIFIMSLLFSCSNEISKIDNPKTDNSKLVEKMIIHQSIKDSWGTITEWKVSIDSTINDSTYQVSRISFNPLIKKETRTTDNYYFNAKLDSILKREDLKTEIKVNNEWIKIF